MSSISNSHLIQEHQTIPLFKLYKDAEKQTDDRSGSKLQTTQLRIWVGTGPHTKFTEKCGSIWAQNINYIQSHMSLSAKLCGPRLVFPVEPDIIDQVTNGPKCCPQYSNILLDDIITPSSIHGETKIISVKQHSEMLALTHLLLP